MALPPKENESHTRREHQEHDVAPAEQLRPSLPERVIQKRHEDCEHCR